jgi:RNA polymerase sigma-70 factor, ECF subfamily
MGQRLFRAKTKTRSGGIPFEIPQERDLPERLDAGLEAIYVAFGIGWDDMAGADHRPRSGRGSDMACKRVLVQLMPGEAEAQGLLDRQGKSKDAVHAVSLWLASGINCAQNQSSE